MLLSRSIRNGPSFAVSVLQRCEPWNPFPASACAFCLSGSSGGRKTSSLKAGSEFRLLEALSLIAPFAGISTTLDRLISESNQVSCHTLCSTQLERTLSSIPFQRFQRFSCVKECFQKLNLFALCARITCIYLVCIAVYLFVCWCTRTYIKIQKNALITHTIQCICIYIYEFFLCSCICSLRRNPHGLPLYISPV